MDPILFAVMEAKMDAVVRKMTLVVSLTARSAILNSCHDFSVSVLSSGETAEDVHLISMYAGVPTHCVSTGLNIKAIKRIYGNDVHEGDAIFNNSPYLGVTHHADYSIAAPVFSDDHEEIFWVILRCHQNDVGMYIPDTYNPYCKDAYMEGPHIPLAKIQENYRDKEEWIRFFRNNIRYSDEWYGDYLSQIGGLRAGENELKEFIRKYGKDIVRQFIDEWLRYTERRMIDAIRKLPKGRWCGELTGDPLDYAPEGIPIKMSIAIDPDEAMVTVDLRESPDNVPGGVNCSEATATTAACLGVWPCIAPHIPINGGSLRRVKVLLRKGCVAGIPKFPASTATATTYVACQIPNIGFRIFAEQIDPALGASEAPGCTAGIAVVAGKDFRNNYEPYGHGMFIIGGGGPATQGYDGWPYWISNSGMGAQCSESIEINELRMPHFFKQVEVAPDTGGAGQWRGGLGEIMRLHPLHTRFSIASFAENGVYPARGVLGGENGSLDVHWINYTKTDKKKSDLPHIGMSYCEEDEDWVVASAGGGGFGDPLDRNPKAVSWDARNEYISLQAARDKYGVVLNTDTELYDVNYEATKILREQLRLKKSGKANNL